MNNETTHNDPATTSVGTDMDIDAEIPEDSPKSIHSQASTKSCSCKSPSKRKTKMWTWKKPKDKPKRPMSAYNIFFKHTRSRIVEGLTEEETIEEFTASIKAIAAKSSTKKIKRDRRKHGQISFKDLARTIAEKWKSLEEHKKSIFKHYAALDKERYRKAVNVWKAKKEAEALTNRSGDNVISETSEDSESSYSVSGEFSQLINSQESIGAGDSSTYSQWCSTEDYDLDPSSMVKSQESQKMMINTAISSISTSIHNNNICNNRGSGGIGNSDNDNMLNKKLEDTVMKNRQLELEVDRMRKVLTKAMLVLHNKRAYTNGNATVSSNSNGSNPSSSSHDPKFSMTPFPAAPSIERMQQLQRVRLLKGVMTSPFGNNQNQQHEREPTNSSSNSDHEIPSALNDPLDELDATYKIDSDPVPFDDICNGWTNAFDF